MARAAIIVTVVESGGNVVMSSPGGTLDISLMANLFNSPATAQINGSNTLFVAGLAGSDSTSGTSDVYGGVVLVPGSFGTLADSADISSGPGVGANGDGLILLPSGYVSGSILDPFSSTYVGDSFASLGLVPGVYTWDWASDTLTLNIVPIPAALWCLFSGLTLLGLIRRNQAANRIHST